MKFALRKELFKIHIRLDAGHLLTNERKIIMKLRKRLLALALTVVMMAGILVMPAYATVYTNGTWTIGNSKYVSAKSCISLLNVTSLEKGITSRCTTYSCIPDSDGNTAYARVTFKYVDIDGTITTPKAGYHKIVNSTLSRDVTMRNYGTVTATYTAAGETSLNYGFMGTFAFE